MINDAHCHFFSTPFFSALGQQLAPPLAPDDVCRTLGWDSPGSPEQLADTWVQTLDAHNIGRAALIASAPGDEDSVGRAVARHRHRIVGFSMVNPSSDVGLEHARRGIESLGLSGLCLFPAMHGVTLDDGRVTRVAEIAAARPGTAIFVHCGVLSVGVRRKLGLPSRFDLRLGDPLAVSRLALQFPDVPFIIPHFGAGLFREALMAADAAPNIHFDTSSSNSWTRYTPGLTLRDAFAAALRVVGPTRLLFGTDSSFFPRGWQAAIYESQRALVTELALGDEDQARIFGGNFDRLFPMNAR